MESKAQTGEVKEVHYVVVAMRPGRPALVAQQSSPIVRELCDGALLLSFELAHAYLVSTRN